MTLILGLETSCDETACALVRDGREALSNIIASQHDLHAEYGGVVPEIASRAHVERILPVVRESLRAAGVGLREVDAIAVGHRPGLIGALLVGVAGAKALALALGKPLIGVDHVHAHLYAPLLTDASKPRAPVSAEALYPALGLVVSGGHTALYRCDGPLTLTRLGSTIDDAVGEAFDKAAAMLGLPHPGGPNLDKLARDGNDRAHDFPVSRLAPDSLDFSYSGLKTSVLYCVRGAPVRAGGVTRFERDHTHLSAQARADIAASFQRAAVRAVTLKIERALDAASEQGHAYRSIIVGGGVSANSRLRTDLARLAERRAVDLHLPAMAYCLDNAAMIAGLAHHRLINADTDDLTLRAEPTTTA